MIGKKYIASCTGKTIKTNTVFAFLVFLNRGLLHGLKKTLLKNVGRPLCRSHAIMLRFTIM